MVSKPRSVLVPSVKGTCCPNCGMVACTSVMCKQHLAKKGKAPSTKPAPAAKAKKAIAKKPAVKDSSVKKLAADVKQLATEVKKANAKKLASKETFVLSSTCEHDGNVDQKVHGVFSEWSELVKAATSFMKQKPEVIHYFFEDAGIFGSPVEVTTDIPNKPFPEHLTHAINIASAYEEMGNTMFTLFAQRTSAA
jgi:hypothetical protein